MEETPFVFVFEYGEVAVAAHTRRHLAAFRICFGAVRIAQTLSLDLLGFQRSVAERGVSISVEHLLVSPCSTIPSFFCPLRTS